MASYIPFHYTRYITSYSIGYVYARQTHAHAHTHTQTHTHTRTHTARRSDSLAAAIGPQEGSRWAVFRGQQEARDLSAS